MRLIVIIFSVLSLAGSVRALPPSPPDKAELVRRSDLVAIVTVTSVTERTAGWFKHKTRKQRATAVVERVLKGTAPQKLQLAYDSGVSDIICRPDSLRSGSFLVLLRRDGDVYVRTDSWYSQHSITTNHVNWFLQPSDPLDTAISDIEKIIKSQ